MHRIVAFGWLACATVVVPISAPAQGAPKSADVFITPSVVDGFIAAYKARDAELRKIAQENTPVGRYYAALIKQEELTRRQNDFRAQVGPDWQKLQQAQNRATSLDDKTTEEQRKAAYGEMNRINMEMAAGQGPLPAVPWDAQRAANDQLTRVMRLAGGFDEAAWKAVVDVIPQVLNAIAATPNAAPKDIAVGRPSGISPEELKALKARRVELARLLVVRYQPDEAQVAAEDAAAPTTGSVGYERCLQREMKPLSDWAEAHKAELEAAQKAGNMAALMSFATRQQQAGLAAQQKCMPLLTKP